jgi:hypothetical protein
VGAHVTGAFMPHLAAREPEQRRHAVLTHIRPGASTLHVRALRTSLLRAFVPEALGTTLSGPGMARTPYAYRRTWHTTGGMLPPRVQPSVSNGLSSFGILLTGRLELRNDLLSALSLGKAGVWDERYFVLTRKGLHFYVRQSAAEDAQGRKVETSGDLFGQHEGSVAIRAMRKVVPSGAEEQLVFTIQTSGLGRVQPAAC